MGRLTEAVSSARDAGRLAVLPTAGLADITPLSTQVRRNTFSVLTRTDETLPAQAAAVDDSAAVLRPSDEPALFRCRQAPSQQAALGVLGEADAAREKLPSRLDYQLGDSPRAYVDDPDLIALAGGRRLPHVYQQQPPCLCLYLPDTEEWAPNMRIVDTIVPWSILWLFYFEDWLETNEWKGGGVHPDAEREGRCGASCRLTVAVSRVSSRLRFSRH